MQNSLSRDLPVSLFAVLAVWFPSIWFIDLIFAYAGGRPVKMVSWAFVFGIALLVAGISQWPTWRAVRAHKVMITAALAAVLYFLGWQLISPPIYDYRQAASLCVLSPLSLFLGVSSRNGKSGPVLAAIGASVVALVLVNAVSGRTSLFSMNFQNYYRSTANAKEETALLRDLAKAHQGGLPQLDPSTLETMVVMAYRQPLTIVELESIRGVKMNNELQALLDNGIIAVTGHVEGPGRPLTYGTTRLFLKYFDLRSLADLPDCPRLRPATSYQGLSFTAGFLPVYLLTALSLISRFYLLRVVLLAATSAIPLLIGGRSAVVALAVTVGSWLAFNRNTLKKQLILVAGVLSLFFAGGLAVASHLQNLPLGIQRLILLVKPGELLRSERLELWKDALCVWLTSPATTLFGVGPQKFPSMAGHDGAGMYPHNFLLELLAEYGLLGFLLFLLPVALSLVQPQDIKAPRPARPVALYFLIYYASGMQFMGGLNSIWPLWFIAGWLAAERSSAQSMQGES